MTFDQVAEKVQEYLRDPFFPPSRVIIDGANKQGLEEMNTRHGTGLVPAEKHGKVEYINLLNGDLRMGRIQALPLAKALVEEWKVLVWMTDGGKIIEPRKEHSGIHNDLSDAFLYVWRYCYNFLWKPPVNPQKAGTLESWEPQHIAKLQELGRKEQNPNELDLDWDESWDPDNDDL
jgi:hypothetical protein